MCGRFSQFLGLPQRAVIHFRKLGLGQFVFPPRFNIAPTQHVPVILRESGFAPRMEKLYWGLVPYWARDMSIGVRSINARAETVDEKPTFRNAFKSRRCLVPASGFYEWQKGADRKGKIPHYFTVREEDEPLAFAGLWERWSKTGEEILSFTIVTTEANAFMRPVHDRMPVILRPEDWEEWLDPDAADHSRLRGLLRPAPEDLLHSWEVGVHVNNARNEGEKCIERAPELPQLPLMRLLPPALRMNDD